MHDNIWFTYKSRIRAQQRLAKNDFHSKLLMIWYALLAACFSVITLKYPKIFGDDTDLISAFCSIGLLAIAMVVANRDFRGRSVEMRRNYLDLQNLHRNATATPPLLTRQDINSEYQRLLDSVESHTEIDDKCARVFQRGLTSRKPTKTEFVGVYAYMMVRAVMFAVLYLAPVCFVVVRTLGPISPVNIFAIF